MSAEWARLDRDPDLTLDEQIQAHIEIIVGRSALRLNFPDDFDPRDLEFTE